MSQYKYFQLSDKSADIISMFCLNKVKPDDASLNFLIMSVIQTEIDNGRLKIHRDDKSMKGYDSEEERKEHYKRLAKELFEKEIADESDDERDEYYKRLAKKQFEQELAQLEAEESD